MFFAAGGFYRFVVGLDDAGFVNDASEAAVIFVVDNRNADADEFLDDFKAGVEVGLLGEDMVGFLGKVSGSEGFIMVLIF